MTRKPANWTPMDDFLSLRDAMNKLFEESFVWPTTWRGGEKGPGRLAIDAYTTPNEIVIQAPVPGATPDDVDITLEGDTLTIKATIKPPLENVDYVIRERAYGTFTRTLTLNVPVDGDKIEATVQNGLLTIVIPKAEAAKPKTIKISTGK